MTLIPKSIASDTVKYQKWQNKFLLIGIFILLILTVFAPLPFGVLLIFGFVRYHHVEKIYQATAHEVIDDGVGLMIDNGRVKTHIAYRDIVAIDYEYHFFIFKNNVVKLTLKPNDGLGDTVYFISWADSCNHDREFRLNPMTQTPETLAWVQMIKEKANL
ncbi:hypothetical protein [Moraxella oblonga]|uniref:hypothetical protein n=1 Tax=Moraxella oblonga TaxID=200413 RepID=UPI0008363EAE|nr:hypothetical protein [Moraxella oblonga]